MTEACLVRDGRIEDDEWTLVMEGEAAPGVIAPVDAWRRNPDGAGVWVQGDADVEETGAVVLDAPVVAVRFPMFADGRGLSLGALLRSRYGFAGELRAFGEVIPDLAEYMHRCGFNAFVLPNRSQAETTIACISRMSDHYQASVRTPTPPFQGPRATHLARCHGLRPAPNDAPRIGETPQSRWTHNSGQ